MAEASLTLAGVARAGGRLGAVAWIRLATLLALLGGYEAVSASGLVFQGAMPGLPSIAGALVRILADPGFYPNLLRTVQEAAGGVLIGGSLGVACGLAFGMSRLLAAVLDPWVRCLAPAPKIVFLPILMLMFGIDAGPKTAMAALSAFFPVVVATYGGMRQVRPILLRVTRSYNATVLQTVRTVYLPSTLIPVLGSLRLAVGVALIGALLAEVKMSNRGLGFLIIQEYNAFRTPTMYALLIIVFVLAMLANMGVRTVARRFGVR